jgi:hypothetical protein
LQSLIYIQPFTLLLSLSCAGGVSPTIVTALVAATGSAVLAPGLLLVFAAVVSMVAALALLKYAPECNRSSPQII